MSLRKKFMAYRAGVVDEFTVLVEPILGYVQVKLLDDHIQHFSFTRLKHSVDVSYYSFFLTKLLGWHAEETARAALLHDLYYLEEGHSSFNLLRRHPYIAVENAKKLFPLTPREENIILRHMWLITMIPPKYKEGFVVTFVDKFCALREFTVSAFTRKKRRSYYPG